MNLEFKVMKELKNTLAKVKDATLSLLVRHPVLAGLSAAVLGANIYYQEHKVDPTFIGAIADNHIDQLSYLLPGYLTYITLGMLRDYGHFAKQRFKLGSSKDSSIKRAYYSLINHPRFNGLAIGSSIALAGVAEQALSSGSNMNTRGALRAVVGTPVVYSLVAETVLRTLRNARLLKQGREEYSKKQGLAEKVLSVLFDHPVIFGAATTAGLGLHWARKSEVGDYISTNIGGLGLTWLIMSNAYMLAGSFLHPSSIKREFYNFASQFAGLFGRDKASLRYLERATNLPSSRRHRLRKLFELGEAHHLNKDIRGTREAYKKAIDVLKSEETALSYFDIAWRPRRHLIEEYKKIANSTNPVLILRSRGCRKFVMKVDKSDYEYRVNLALENILPRSFPLAVSITCLRQDDGTYAHFMIRKHLPTLAKVKTSLRGQAWYHQLRLLATLHSAATEAFRSCNHFYPLPHSDTEKVLQVSELDYKAEFFMRAIQGKKPYDGKRCRLSSEYEPGKDHALDDLIEAYHEEVLPRLQQLPRMFIHHDISETNTLVDSCGSVTLIDYGVATRGTPLIDVDRTLTLFHRLPREAGPYLEEYRQHYNQVSRCKLSRGELPDAYPYVALHNALCMLGFALYRDNKDEIKTSVVRVLDCAELTSIKRVNGPFTAIIKRDPRIRRFYR